MSLDKACRATQFENVSLNQSRAKSQLNLLTCTKGGYQLINLLERTDVLRRLILGNIAVTLKNSSGTQSRYTTRTQLATGNSRRECKFKIALGAFFHSQRALVEQNKSLNVQI